MENNNKYTVIVDPDYGYRRLDPLPDDDELTEFYESHYYDLIRKGQRAAGIRRIMEGSDSERSWLQATLYADVLAVLKEHIGSAASRVIDIGCGTGEFILFMKQKGWDATGLELSAEAVEIARKMGLDVHNESVEAFQPKAEHRFDAVTMFHVLEHIPDPVGFLGRVKGLLSEDGMVVIQVPNDFSELQLIARERLQCRKWWIAVPDHINYFDFKSLNALLARLGFEVVHSQGTFPMEMFLLMGDNYVDNPELGSVCHKKRTSFEMSLPGELRRRMYRALSEDGVGRDCLVFARKAKDGH
jgi:2-polyprenyl-3-methyl-5-hydroxy-6-metoxy-1,4-benzoquinol methylase